jgi:2-hydroxychromene-2-carboxylate isomerase
MIDFYFDCSSPWTYIAFRNLQAMAAELDAPISWRPVLVGGIFNSVNQNMYASREDMDSPRNRYQRKDLQDNARTAGLHIVFPPRVFPVNSVKAMRGCLWIAQDARAKSRYLPFVEATFAAYFSREEDISQDDVLAAICREVGIDAPAFLEGIARPDIKEQLKANTDEAIRRGAFGSPTFFVGDDMYFGNDRLPLLRAAVLRAQAS